METTPAATAPATPEWCNHHRPNSAGRGVALCTLDAGHEGPHRDGPATWPAA